MSVIAKLAAARGEFPPIVHNRENPHFRSSYADLGAILDAVTPALDKHGLVLVQHINGQALHTELYALEDEESDGLPDLLRSIYPLPQLDDPQKLGSAITYARRYSISTLLGLTTEKDDDGNAASTVSQNRSFAVTANKPNQETPKVPKGWLSHEDAAQKHAEIVERINTLSPQKKELCSAFKAEHGWPLDTEKYAQLEQLVADLSK